MSDKQLTAVEWLFEQTAYNRELTIEDWKHAKEIEKDQMEAEIIKICAEQSTSEASKYAEGYKAGYHRALELVEWKIKTLK